MNMDKNVYSEPHGFTQSEHLKILGCAALSPILRAEMAQRD